jgi:repressor LexA
MADILPRFGEVCQAKIAQNGEGQIGRRRADLPNMGNNLKRLRELKGWTHEEAAEAMGISRGAFIKLERGERKLNEDSISTAADAFGVTREVVLAEKTPIRVVGRVGAGGSIDPEFEQVPAEGLSTVDLPFAVPDGISGLEVIGDSMLPVYRSGDVILVWDEQRRPTDSFLGEEAAVLTDTGLRALKEVQRGRAPTLYNLHSHNAQLIEDVRIRWVGEIYIVVKAKQIIRLHRANHISLQRKASVRSKSTVGMDELSLNPTRAPPKGKRKIRV